MDHEFYVPSYSAHEIQSLVLLKKIYKYKTYVQSALVMTNSVMTNFLLSRIFSVVRNYFLLFYANFTPFKTKSGLVEIPFMSNWIRQSVQLKSIVSAPHKSNSRGDQSE